MKLTGDSDGWRLGHRPALDGIRAIAVLMVLWTHFIPGQPLLGVVGVTVFFTLSGFLITTLLLEERATTGRISWGEFYRRRALRLLPALVVVVGVVCVLTLLGWPTDVGPGMVAAIVGYSSNWYLTATAINGEVQWNALSHTWSLAIEEQFYIVWPVVVLLASRWGRRGVLSTAAAGAVASASWGLASGRSNLDTDVSAYGLLVGCALAAWMHSRPAVPVPSWLPAGALAGVFGLAVAGASDAGYVAVPLLAAASIFAAVQVDDGWLAGRSMVWIGRRSYGLYLWHLPVAYLLLPAGGHQPLIVVAAAGAVLSFALTAASWRWVERPFLQMKSGARSRPRQCDRPRRAYHQAAPAAFRSPFK